MFDFALNLRPLQNESTTFQILFTVFHLCFFIHHSPEHFPTKMLLRAFSAFYKFNRCIITSITIISKYSSHTNKPEWKMDKSLTQNETLNANIPHRFLFRFARLLFFLFSSFRSHFKYMCIESVLPLNKNGKWNRCFIFHLHLLSLKRKFVIYCKIQCIWSINEVPFADYQKTTEWRKLKRYGL